MFKQILISLLMFGMVGCSTTINQGHYNVQDFAFNNIPKNHGELYNVKATPWWNVLDPAAKIWVVNNNGKLEIYSVGSGGDLLSQMSGPFSGLASHVVIPTN